MVKIKVRLYALMNELLLWPNNWLSRDKRFERYKTIIKIKQSCVGTFA